MIMFLVEKLDTVISWIWGKLINFSYQKISFRDNPLVSQSHGVESGILRKFFVKFKG